MTKNKRIIDKLIQYVMTLSLFVPLFLRSDRVTGVVCAAASSLRDSSSGVAASK